jgi:hypothetical protein
MIPFFRKIRKKMADDNKPLKYMRYAIGEIALVVIGILIALSINNWNEKRLEKQTLNNIYTIIAEDLKNDISEINHILKVKKEKEPIFNKILDGLMTEVDYNNCNECEFLIVGNPNLTINKRGYNLLNNLSSSIISTDSLTIKIAQFYTILLIEITADDDVRASDIANNVNDWKDNYNWYSDYITERNNNGFIEYALNNHDYTNRVANYYLNNYEIYIPKLKRFNTEAKVILKQLEDKIKQ